MRKLQKHKAARRTISKSTLSRSEQAYRQIRLEILTFGLLPGEAISEASLAERFDLTIAAVRAALPRLRQEGLLHNQLRRGQVVSAVTVEDIRQTYEMRYILEPAAAEKAVKSIDIKKLQELDKRSCAPVRPQDKDADIETIFANRDFHVAIGDDSGNYLLAKYIHELHDRMVRFQYLLRESEIGKSTWEHSHDDIIAAFKKGDPKLAAETVREHVRMGLEYTLQAVMKFPEVQKLPLGLAKFPE